MALTVGALQYVLSIEGGDVVASTLERNKQAMAEAASEAETAGQSMHSMGTEAQAAGDQVGTLGDEAAGTGDQVGQTAGQLGLFGDEAAGAGEQAGQASSDVSGLGDDMVGAGEQAATMAGDVSAAGADIEGAGESAAQASGDVGGFGDQVEETGQQTAQSGQVIKDSLRDIGAVIVGAFATHQLVNFTSELLRTSAQVRTNTQLMEFAFADSEADVRQWSDEWRSQLGMTESQMDGFTSNLGFMLQAVGFGTDEAAKMTTEFGTLAIAMANVDPKMRGTEQAAQAIGSAITGSRQQLAEYGVVIHQSHIDNEMAAQGFDHLTGAAREQAEAQALLTLITQNTQGAMQQLEENGIDPAMQAANEMDGAVAQLRENLASRLEPVLEQVAGVLSGVLGEEWSSNALLAAAFGLVLFNKVIPRLRDAHAASTGLGGGLRGLARGLGPSVGIAGAAALATQIVQGWNAEQERAKNVGREWAEVLRETNGELEGTAQEIVGNSDEFEKLRGLMADTSVDADRFLGVIEGSRDPLRDVRDLTGDLSRALSAGKFGVYADELLDLADGGNEFAAILHEIVDAGELTGSELIILVREILAANDAGAQAEEIFAGMENVLNDTGDAAEDTAGQVSQLEDELAALNDQLEEHYGLVQESIDSMFDAEDAAWAWETAVQDLREATEENSGSIDDNTEAAANQRQAFADATDATLANIQAIDTSTMSHHEVRDAVWAHIDALIDEAMQMGLTRDEAMDLVERGLGPIDDNFIADVAMDKGTIEKDIRDIDGQLNSLTRTRNAYIVAQIIRAGDGHGAIPAEGRNTRGWRGHSGGVIPGGESRPVPLLALGGEEILSHDDPRHQHNMQSSLGGPGGSLGGGSGGGSTVIELHASDRMGRAVMEALRADIRRVAGSGKDSVQVALGRAH